MTCKLSGKRLKCEARSLKLKSVETLILGDQNAIGVLKICDDIRYVVNKN